MAGLFIELDDVKSTEIRNAFNTIGIGSLYETYASDSYIEKFELYKGKFFTLTLKSNKESVQHSIDIKGELDDGLNMSFVYNIGREDILGHIDSYGDDTSRAYVLRTMNGKTGYKNVSVYFLLGHEKNNTKNYIYVGNSSNDKSFYNACRETISTIRMEVVDNILQKGNLSQTTPKVGLALIRSLYREYMVEFERTIEKNNLISGDHEKSLELINKFKGAYDSASN